MVGDGDGGRYTWWNMADGDDGDGRREYHAEIWRREEVGGYTWNSGDEPPMEHMGNDDERGQDAVK